METIFWFAVGVVIGLFLPGPFNTLVRTWLTSLWNRIFKGSSVK